MRHFPLVFAVLALAGCASGSSEPRPNLTMLKEDCVKWHDSGAYEKAFARATAPAQRALDRYLSRKGTAHRAIVFDIDETLLSNWPYLEERQFAVTLETFTAWTEKEKAIPLLPTCAIYNRAKAAGIPIFLITGRPEKMRSSTIRDLNEASLTGWTGLYLKPPTYTGKSIVPFKSGIRKMLSDKGYDIVMNLGDQDSDLAGGYARHRFKLPNPFYFIR